MERMQIHPILAGLGACLIGSLISALLLMLFGFAGTVESASDIVGGTLAVGLYGFVFALPIVFLYGMHIYAILSRFRAVNISTVLLFGALPGIAWVIWSRSSWLDPILWHGTLIAFFYYLMRQWNAKP